MTINTLFADLTYRQYRASREASPDITPRSWGFVYGPAVDAMEERYQREIAAQANAGIKKEQRERLEGRKDDSGMDIFGGPLKFGS